MYRLNCNISDDIASRLGEYCERVGVSRADIVALALDDYLTQQITKRKMLDELSNPAFLTEIYKNNWELFQPTKQGIKSNKKND